MRFTTEAYVTQLENGKINLTVDVYNEILKLLEFKRVMTTSICIDDIQSQIDGKGAMYMKNSNREIAKQIIFNYIEKRKEDWCSEGILACMELVNAINSKNPTVTIKNDEYPVYDGTDCGNYELVGNEYRLDINNIVDILLNNVEKLLDDLWSVPTIEGPWISLYHLIG